MRICGQWVLSRDGWVLSNHRQCYRVLMYVNIVNFYINAQCGRRGEV